MPTLQARSKGNGVLAAGATISEEEHEVDAAAKNADNVDNSSEFQKLSQIEDESDIVLIPKEEELKVVDSSTSQEEV